MNNLLNIQEEINNELAFQQFRKDYNSDNETRLRKIRDLSTNDRYTISTKEIVESSMKDDIIYTEHKIIVSI